MPKKKSKPKTNQPPEPEVLPSGEVALYHLTGVWMPEFGFARPDEPAYLPPELAAGYIESDPNYWSYAPFVSPKAGAQKKPLNNEESVSAVQETEASLPANADAEPTEVNP